MLSTLSRQIAAQSARYFSTSKQNSFRVAVLGACGGIGQPLSLLLKYSKYIKQLVLYDIVKHTPGVAADISHIDTPPKIQSFMGTEQLECALQCSDVVVIPAGVPRKPGMTRDDLFDTNAQVIKDLAGPIAKCCPEACVLIITNPVNSVVPIAAEIMKKNCGYNPKKLFGVTSLDTVRARTFIGEFLKVDPKKIQLPVICGHSGISIIPVISQSKPKFTGSEEDVKKLNSKIQEAGTEVVKAKAGTGSATLAMGHAGALFTEAVLKGLSGEKGVIECAYVESNICSEVNFFATPLLLGKNGIEQNCGLPNLNDFEKNLLATAIPELKKNIQKGLDFAKK